MLQTQNTRDDIAFGEQTFGMLLPDFVRLFSTFNALGFWRIDIDSGHSFCDERTAEIYGFDYRDGPIGLMEFSARIHPEDLGVVMESHELAAVDHCSFQKIHRVLQHGNTYKFICCLGTWRAKSDTGGEIVGVVFDMPKQATDLQHFP
ncbi:hypothetical protein SAMN05880590_102593 [Rhizobium sp. RU35A]|uniref:PAS domain-containing protein n=1 Tax=Rhizobium straminoryzae TaxID=1387186 RepID=A0A549TDF2_9HYPH|nr:MULTISPECIES: PAS domain-containing protein [Rhizobium]TRL40084.1 PAS domain-containing protein [Rhizobium straminoryzae]SIQ21017.1 hypothetical protein SAMN05880590_102593 [Rhizobium sp. RU35A]